MHRSLQCALLLLVIVLTSRAARAQQTPNSISYTAFVSLRHLDPSTTFGGVPGLSTCCPGLGSGTGLGGSVLAGVTVKQPKDEFGFDLLIGGSYNGMSFTKDDFIGWSLVGSGDQARADSAISRSVMNLRMVSVEGRVQASYMPEGLSGLGLVGGASGLFHFSANAEQRESLLRPVNAVYDDTKTRERLAGSASVVDQTGVWIAGFAGLGWQSQISDQLMFRSSFSYEVPFTSVIKRDERTIDMGMIRLDLGLTFSMFSDPVPVSSSTPDPEPIQKRKTWLQNGLRVQELRPDGTLNNIGIVRIEETLSKQIYPLLPYVFFQEAESVLDANKYTNLVPRQTATFNETKDFTFDRARTETRSAITLEMYYNILNIVGRRMRNEYPTATIELNGYNNGRGAEKNDTLLSKKRAESVKDYLVRVWSIDARRITVRGGNLSPRAASTAMADLQDREDGYQENRRVELIPSDTRVLDPVVINDTLREINVPALRYTLGVQGDAQVRDWSLEALHPFMPQTSSHGTILQRQAPGDPPSYVDWQPGDSQREIPKSSDPVFAAFVVNGSEGETDTASNRLAIEYFSIARKVQERIGNLSVDRFRLPLFAYGNDKLLVAQADIINRYVRPELDPTAVIVVQAFTDRKGASTSNQSLSQQRADQIRSILKDVPASTVKGYGEGTEEQKAPFTNESPEGRLYNRTVEITLYKKIE